MPLPSALRRQPGFALRVPLATFSDERLAALAAAGDQSAFSTLYERYRVKLARYCRSILNDPEDAADALQNTMLAALRGLDRDPPSGKVQPWLYRIAHNESIDLIRRRRLNDELTAEVPERGSASHEQAELAERLQALLSDLQSLPERQRGALVLRELSGLEYGEIARVFGISSVAARKLVYEARVSLGAIGSGRELACEQIRRRLSDGDGRTARARRVRSHLNNCPECFTFAASIQTRREQLALLPALPVAAIGGSLVVGAGAGAGKAIVGSATVGAASAGGAGAMSGIGGALAVKCLSVCGALAVAGAGAMIVDHSATHHPTPRAQVVHAAAAPRAAARPAVHVVSAPVRHVVVATAGVASKPSAAAVRGPVSSVTAVTVQRPSTRPGRIAAPAKPGAASQAPATSQAQPAAPAASAPAPVSVSTAQPGPASTSTTASAPVTPTATPSQTPATPASVLAAAVSGYMKLAAGIAGAAEQAASSAVQSGVSAWTSPLNGTSPRW